MFWFYNDLFFCLLIYLLYLSVYTILGSRYIEINTILDLKLVLLGGHYLKII